MPNIVAGNEANSGKLSIGTNTVLAPFSERRDTLSEKLVALTIAPPMEILPMMPNAGFRFLPKTEETIAANTAEPMPPTWVVPE